jgi:transcriptional regulator with XRE-family HTH domain
VKTHKEMVSKWMQDPKFKKEYDDLNEEFTILKEMLRARKAARLSQADVAKRMGTKPPAVARLEAAGGSKRHSPSVATLRKYADAVGCRLEIKIIPR